MPSAKSSPVVSFDVDPDDGAEDEGPLAPWLPPDDRLWRHPSEAGQDPTSEPLDFLFGGTAPVTRTGMRPTPMRTWTVAVTAGLVGALLASSVSMAVGEYGRRTTVLQAVTRLAPPDTLSATHFTVGRLPGTPVLTSPAASSSSSAFPSSTDVSTSATTAPLKGAATSATTAISAIPTASTTSLASVTSPTSAVSPTSLAFSPSLTSSTSVVDWGSIDDAVGASVVAIMTSDGSSGAGVIYAEGSGRTYVLTTNQLGRGQIHVTFNDGEIRSARLVRADEKSGLALLVTSGGSRPVATFASVANVGVADTVMAIGAGADAGSLPTPLTVQSLDDAVIASDDQTMIGMVAVTGSAPTDDGGALVDASGDVVGITTSVTAPDVAQQNTSFAVPADVARHVAEALMTGRQGSNPYTGLVNGVDLAPILAHQLGVGGGARVQTVAAASPAAKAGLSPQDVITAVSGHPVDSTGTLVALLSGAQPGASLRISYLHQGKPAVATVRVIEQPASVVNAEGY